MKKLMDPGCFLATIDLKDAYNLLPIHKSCRKFFRSEFEKKMYEFTCLLFGLNIAPLIFTKLMKPVVSYLPKQNLLPVIYLDDLLTT